MPRIIQLSSNSTDLITTSFEDGKRLIYKKFLSNLKRARKCIDKQIRFSSVNSNSVIISSVPTLSFESTPDSITICMPYIEGYTGSQFFIHGTKALAEYLSRSLSVLLELEFMNSVETEVPIDIFKSKLNDIESSSLSCNYAKFFEQAKDLLSDSPSTLILPVGECHGDLTLSNIIFNPLEGLVLIDFLDTYLDSPFQDVAKIMQDYLYFWSARHESLFIKVKSEIFGKNSLPHYARKIYYESTYEVNLFLMLTLFRIVPYVTNDATDHWLRSSLQKFFSTINGNLNTPII